MAEDLKRTPVSLQELANLGKDLEDLRSLIEGASLGEKLNEIERELQDPKKWNSSNPRLSKLLKERKRLERILNKYSELLKEFEALKDTYEFLFDGDLANDWLEEYRDFKRELKEFKMQMLLKDELDPNDAILTVHAGTGGTDAQDWAEMLMRMYINWAHRKKFKVKLTHYQIGQEAGIKSATLIIEGDNAYGLLRGEAGVHRLVRLSPFNANHKRQTSFALVEVLPKIDDEIKVEIKPSDLKIETFKAGGHGGQHVNKNETAVRITHLPTGITVVCSNERSQHQNKEIALRILKSRLYQLERSKQEEKLRKLKGEHRATWGNQIRNYVLHPYKLVKDLRTGYETSNVESVLDGEIDEFIYRWLIWKAVSSSDSSSQEDLKEVDKDENSS